MSGLHLTCRDKKSEQTYRERLAIKHSQLPHVFQLVDAIAEVQLDIAVAELEIPDKSRRIPVPRRKDRHLEDLAGLYRGLVDSLPGQRLRGGSGQKPVRHLAILVGD